MSKLAAIRIRGQIGIDVNIRKTLIVLKLLNKHVCAVFENTPSMKGMLVKVKDYVAWGEIDDETYTLLMEKRGEEYKGPLKDKSGKIDYSKKYIEINGKKIKPVFRMHPPKGGYEKKGIKTPYTMGGALGYRADKMNDLVKKMI